MSSGAKIGIGVGVPVGVIALVALLLLLFYRRRKNNNLKRAELKEHIDDYKFDVAGAGAGAGRTGLAAGAAGGAAVGAAAGAGAVVEADSHVVGGEDADVFEVGGDDDVYELDSGEHLSPEPRS
ncbi:uncharacterized protein V1510DRAFT_417485 [Dipodascopsis tothii]|uniref:uncharacterized protein n=1 Tax=Dipodascopsis tothii TaxID=44089 RepID=UPI0034CD966A